MKPDGSPENVPMYPYEIPGRLSSLSQLDYSAQILLGATMDDLDGKERDRLRNIIKYRKGDKTLLELILKVLLYLVDRYQIIQKQHPHM